MRIYQYYNTNDDDDRDGYGVNWMAQTFTPETDHVIGKVKLKLFRVGDPGTITVSIKATAAGKPVGADLCSGIIIGTDITLVTTGEWYEISFGDGFDLDIGAQYAIVVRAPSGDASNKVSWRADITDPTFTGGTFVSSSDSGVDWGIVSGVDCMFEEWGVGPASPSTIVWGNLFKSQISAEKIEEAINRLIQGHEDDPDAHIETGESLQSHKAQEIIDHIAASIIADKIKAGEVWEKHRHSTSAWRRLLAAWPFEALKLIKQLWTGETGQNQCVALTFDGTYIYAGLFGQPVRVIKINTATMATVAVWTGPTDGIFLSSLTFDGTYVYAGCDCSPAKVFQINPATMATVATWTGASGVDYCYSLTCDGTYIYAGLRMAGPTPPPAKVVQINPATMATVATWTGAAGELICHALTFDGTYIYAGLYISPAKVVQINPATMATVATWTGASGENSCRCIMFDGNYVYAGLHLAPAKVVQIDTDEMATITVWTGTSGQNLPYVLTFDGTYIYAGLYVTPMKAIKINPVTMATVETWSGASGENSCRAMIFDGEFVYFGMYISPAEVIRKVVRERLARAKTVRQIIALRADITYTSTVGTTYASKGSFITFDKNKYPNLVSIKFAAKLYTAVADGIAYAILKDQTGGSEITGSELSSTETNSWAVACFKISGDIKANIPSGENIYVFRMKTNDAAKEARLVNCYLIIEYKIVA